MPVPMRTLPATPDFSATPLAALTEWADSQQGAPVDSWHPAHVGSIDIHILADGRWLHEGGAISRPAMVRLFASVLRREADGSHVLVTPAEQLTIKVDDAAFVAVEARVEGEGDSATIALRLNTGAIIIIGPDHPLVLRDGPAGRLPYARVRGTAERPLEARLARPVYYALAELADAEGQVWSHGRPYPIGDVMADPV